MKHNSLGDNCCFISPVVVAAVVGTSQGCIDLNVPNPQSSGVHAQQARLPSQLGTRYHSPACERSLCQQLAPCSNLGRIVVLLLYKVPLSMLLVLAGVMTVDAEVTPVLLPWV